MVKPQWEGNQSGMDKSAATRAREMILSGGLVREHSYYNVRYSKCKKQIHSNKEMPIDYRSLLIVSTQANTLH